MIFYRQIVEFCFYSLKHPRVKVAAVAAIFIFGVNLILFLFFCMPAALQNHRLQRAIDDHQSKILEINRAQTLADRYENLSKRVSVLETKWASPNTQSELIRSLDRLAAKEGLKVVSQDFDLQPSGGSGKCFVQNITLTGNYVSLKKFLDELENLPTLTLVEQARLERIGEGVQVRANLELTTYNKSPFEKRS